MLPTLLYHLLRAVALLRPDKEYRNLSGPLILCGVFSRVLIENHLNNVFIAQHCITIHVVWCVFKLII